PATPRAATPPPAPAPTVDPSNPFQMLRPNALGLPLSSGHTAVLLDAVDRSSAWFDDAKAALVPGLSRSANNQTASLVLIRDGQVVAYNRNPFTPAANQISPLNRFLNPITAQGSRGLGNGLDAAVATGADHIVFITSRSTNWAGYLTTLERKLRPDGRRITLHIVQVGDASDDLRAFTTGANGGRYVQLDPAQLASWRSAAGQ
ncbi:MAG: hypothetical protein AAFX76_08610, partial [Planctomycetota bacterium]